MGALELSLYIAVIVIIALLGVIAWQLYRNTRVNLAVYPQLSMDLSDQIQQLKEATEHFVDVSAVVIMMRQLDELDEDALELIKSYPETVRAAALLHYVNVSGADLQAAQKSLSRAHQGQDQWYSYGGVGVSSQSHLIQARQQHVDTIRAKLDHAIELSGHTGLRAV